MSRKGCAAAPGFQRRCTNCRGCFAALSRHKAAPTGSASAEGVSDSAGPSLHRCKDPTASLNIIDLNPRQTHAATGPHRFQPPKTGAFPAIKPCSVV
ncbi:hypothetical protein CXG45_02505 [Pseudomonas plecoglossicida]|uniref:Uncharacterized protein n=1 Tax=Pseudomonas plecoglossicida TaxID=70775 RepID=A0ABX4U735_PSEDL|nr:hypothetical protein CXG44_14030 [Pseudomonas plecoglossicida]PLU95922.1 hypothetical protein CXG45_02505 [Pseudomonas plecoglossicida]PLV06763.1 hypothetical protein CXG48_00755 [Pseudomonas plecoglossicida]PLV16954.1 hypothetical protein CXG47_02075 [Pseudomonas plecoglossicida]